MINSERAPAISTPVGPPPTRTMVSAPADSARIRAIPSACSKGVEHVVAQPHGVLEGLQRIGVLGHPGMPKSLVDDPAARIRKSYGTERSSSTSTSPSPRSTPVTVPSRTSTLA